MNKFEDVDVIASLEAIMKQNTAFYQNDFDLDGEYLCFLLKMINSLKKLLL